jgi:2',3'-cyclic-nucleotide 2'-phosphodiesterase (5'-nucleotidase family)
MRHRLRWAVVLLGLAACAVPHPPPTNPIRFLLINDVYVTDTLADGTGGLARVATVRNRLAQEGPVLFVLAGDELSPSLLSKYYSGRQMVDALNAAKLDYATFGNHEWELPRDTLVARIAASNFKWLSANCTEASGQPFPKVVAWDTVRVRRQLVGIFGLTLQGDYRKYVHCGDPDSAAKIAVDTLAKVGAQLIVALTHQSLAADQALLGRESRLDLILGGHEHEAHDTVVGGRHVLKADANARSAQFVTLWGAKGQWREAPRLLHMDAEVPLDTTVEKVVRAWTDSLKVRLGPEKVIGTAVDTINARDAALRRQETSFGDLVTDAMRVGTGADVALLNAGTLRLDDVIRPGPVTNYQIESAFLFADEARVVRFPLTGAALREVLEHGVADGSIGAGPFLQVSGIRFTYDPGRPSGQRLTEMMRTNGHAIGPDETLTVAFDVYPACESGDGYRVPAAAGACANQASAPRAADLVLRYIAGPLGGRITTPPGGRISRR